MGAARHSTSVARSTDGSARRTSSEAPDRWVMRASRFSARQGRAAVAPGPAQTWAVNVASVLLIVSAASRLAYPAGGQGVASDVSRRHSGVAAQRGLASDRCRTSDHGHADARYGPAHNRSRTGRAGHNGVCPRARLQRPCRPTRRRHCASCAAWSSASRTRTRKTATPSPDSPPSERTTKSAGPGMMMVGSSPW